MGGLRWGIIGFGEVGAIFARQIAGIPDQRLAVTDPLLAHRPLPEVVATRLAGLPIAIVADIAALVGECDLVLSLVTPRFAAQVAAEAAAAAPQGLFVDFNSVSPAMKQHAADQFAAGAYVDGAILGAIAGSGAGTPLVLAGPQAGQAQAWLSGVGFHASVAGPAVGAASALKMCRSIFMKGLECLYVETLLAAAAFGSTEAVLATIEDTYAAYGPRPLMEMLVRTHAAHCGRRADEMQGVSAMLHDLYLPRTMSQAAEATLRASAASGVAGYFGGQVPTAAADVIGYLSRAYKEAPT